MVTLNEYLRQPCPEEHMQEKDGVLYIPIEVMEEKLDALMEFGVSWSTRNYRSAIIPSEHREDILVSASLELVLDGPGYSRSLVGATTFLASSYEGNMYLDAIAKSLCTVNAASDLGNMFGRYLSTQEKVVESGGRLKSRRPEAKKLEPDAKIRTAYAKAVAAGNTPVVEKFESMYKFN